MGTIVHVVPNSFKLEVLYGIHDLRTDQLKLALYDLGLGANLDANTTTYTPVGEVASGGYNAGGIAMTLAAGFPAMIGTTAAVRYNDVVWTGVTFATDGAMIYNSSKGNRAVMCLAFATRQSPSNGVFSVRFPLSLPPLIQQN